MRSLKVINKGCKECVLPEVMLCSKCIKEHKETLKKLYKKWGVKIMDNKEKLIEWLKDCPFPYEIDNEFMEVVTVGFNIESLNSIITNGRIK